MEISSLGFINTIGRSGKNPQISPDSGFAALYSTILNSAVSGKENVSLISTYNKLGNQDLKSLLGFLKTEDVLDLKDGLTLINNALKGDNTGLLSVIKAFLGMNDHDVLESVKNLQSLTENVLVNNGSNLKAPKALDTKMNALQMAAANTGITATTIAAVRNGKESKALTGSQGETNALQMAAANTGITATTIAVVNNGSNPKALTGTKDETNATPMAATNTGITAPTIATVDNTINANSTLLSNDVIDENNLAEPNSGLDVKKLAEAIAEKALKDLAEPSGMTFGKKIPKVNFEMNSAQTAESNVDMSVPSPVEDSSSVKEMELIAASLNQILALSNQDLPRVVNQDFRNVAIVAKLYELLDKGINGIENNPKYKKLIEQTIQKLEVLLDQNKGVPRAEYLEKAFSKLAAEIRSPNRSEVVPDKHSLPLKTDLTNGFVHLQQMSKPEQLVLMLDHPGKQVTTEQLIKQFESILAKSQFTKTGGTQKLFIKLNPENLGSIRIELIQKDAAMVAKIITSTGAAKDMLESQLQGLKNAFSSQNIQVDRIEVSQQASPQQERFFHRDQQQGQQQKQEQPQQQQKDEEEVNINSFAEALLNTEV